MSWYNESFFLCNSAYPSEQTKRTNQKTKKKNPYPLPLFLSENLGKGGVDILYENTNSVELSGRVFLAIFLPPHLFIFSFLLLFPLFLFSYHFYFFFHHWQILIGLFFISFFRKRKMFFLFFMVGWWVRKIANSCMLHSINMHRVLFYFIPSPFQRLQWCYVLHS